MSRGALFTTPLKLDLGASWCAGVIALLKSQSLVPVQTGHQKKEAIKKYIYLSLALLMSVYLNILVSVQCFSRSSWI